MQDGLQVDGREVDVLPGVADHDLQHRAEELGVLRLLRVPLVLVQRVLQLQRQAVVVLLDHVQNLVLRGCGQVLGGEPMLDLWREMLDYGPNVYQTVVQLLRVVLELAVPGRVSHS